MTDTTWRTDPASGTAATDERSESPEHDPGIDASAAEVSGDPIPEEQPAEAATGSTRRSASRRSGSRRSSTKRSGSRRDALTLGQARTAVRVVAAVRDADETTFATTAALAGVTGDRDDLVVAVLSGRVDASPLVVRDVAEIAAAGEAEAPVVAGMLGRARVKAAWEVVRATGADGLQVELPDADVKAALALARAIRGRNDDQIAVIEAATGLLTT